MGQITEILNKWFSSLKEADPDCYLVGGAVRDFLLGRPTKDIDLITSKPEILARLIARDRNAAVIAFREGTDKECVRVLDRDEPEVYVDIAPVRGLTIADDLLLRDFTINAMALKIGPCGKPGDIIDPLNGSYDLKNQLIRVVRPEAFFKDPLRMLRAFRFAADLGFLIEPSTLSAIKNATPLILTVSSERILVELIAILNTSHSTDFIKMMDKSGLIDVLFPEVGPMKGCKQNNYHHLDVWDHSLMTTGHCEYIINHLHKFFGAVYESVINNLQVGNRLALLKLAALFHDVAKPECRGNSPRDSHITFYGHPERGAEIVASIASRLKMSNQHLEFLCTMIAEHMHLLSLSRSGVKTATLMRWFRKLGDNIIALIILEMADTMATLGPDSKLAEQDYFIEWSKKTVTAYYGHIKRQLERQDLISGKDLIALGMDPGPGMGMILKQVRQAQDEGQVQDRDNALLLASNLMNRLEAGVKDPEVGIQDQK
ncbi:Polynucleotide adenylyltransferase/metal dependent phosphohydrolase [uncultured Desulfobacterium sp.]|uniref:Polynucleotide adenylyltransferase/metal dependent phosphohydrolase n=1 Tax=uncultured Desulfobacterium sp. TaxID=201089 RepID=A0A445N310_9BACT|nr:Polynucleotide adenylyltransferase/metal dependent phosphohydrolase [uncultured Desulfobacterium sp.]